MSSLSVATTTAKAPAQRVLRSVAPSPKKGRNRRAIALTVILGLVGIELVQLFIGVMISQGAYQLADLKTQKRDLTLTTQILGQQVSSLSSNQNLANAAQHLGMISNVNPVYLRLADKKVFGVPVPASAGESGHIARNLVPDAAMTVVSSFVAPKQKAVSVAAKVSTPSEGSLDAQQAAGLTPVAAKAPVAQPKSASNQVPFSSAEIPASPTH
jgi:hypothetical protein